MFRRRRLDQEVAAHVAEETADNMARGMDPASARHAALRTFGNVEAAKERARELDPWYWLDTLWQDVRFALRLIARSFRNLAVADCRAGPDGRRRPST